MNQLSLLEQFLILGVLLFLSAFFSISETAMIASNRFRLKHWAKNGNQGAIWALDLLNQSERLLGMILLGNNLVNAAAATLVGVIAIDLFGKNEWALSIATLAITFAILVFSEITPKIIGARYAENLAIFLAYILMPLLKLLYPVVYFVNLFPKIILWCLRLNKTDDSKSTLTNEELRTLILENSQHLPLDHRNMLAALFEIQNLKVEDIMTPRPFIDFLDLTHSIADLRRQISTCQHSILPVCQGSLDNLLGVLPLRSILENLSCEHFQTENIVQEMRAPYYLPLGTPIGAQLSFFKKNHHRLGFVVDEYGEILGIVTLSSIVEELIGDFDAKIQGLNVLKWSENNDILVEGATTLRDLNRKLQLNFPLNGPKTINGLITEYLEEIPDGEVCLKINQVPIEIVHTEDKSILTIKIFKPLEK